MLLPVNGLVIIGSKLSGRYLMDAFVPRN